MGSENWRDWDNDSYDPHGTFKAEDLTKKRQLKKAEELTRDDVLGARHHIMGVYCKVCEKEWNRGAINVCSECIEYYCDTHITRHPNCSNGR